MTFMNMLHVSKMLVIAIQLSEVVDIDKLESVQSSATKLKGFWPILRIYLTLTNFLLWTNCIINKSPWWWLW